MNMSPCGPLLQEMEGNSGQPTFEPPWFGVSLTLSDPRQPSRSSPQMWSRFSQWPTSWVAVRPRSKGASTIPVVPKAVFRTTTPSDSGGPPGNCA